MLSPNEKIILTIIISTLMILLFAVIVVIAILKYRRKQREYKEREQDIKTELIKAVLEAKEKVLEDISDQVHVEIQQTLSLAKININKALLNSNSNIQNQFQPTKELIDKAIGEVKTLARSFDPKMITGHTLEDNIARQLNHVTEKTDINTIFKTSEEEIRISDEKQIFIYRIVQEAINNILSHAQANKISIALENKAKNFVLNIKDNGIGFDRNVKINGALAKNSGAGLRSIHHRTELLNGHVEVISEPNNGTEINLTIPYEN